MHTTTQALDQLRSKTSATLGNVAEDVGAAAHQIKDATTHAGEAIQSDMMRLLESAKSSGKAELASAAERLSLYLNAAAESATALQKQGRDAVRYAADTTDTYVHDKPWQSVAIGAGIGAVVGFALACAVTRR